MEFTGSGDCPLRLRGLPAGGPVKLTNSPVGGGELVRGPLNGQARWCGVGVYLRDVDYGSEDRGHFLHALRGGWIYYRHGPFVRKRGGGEEKDGGSEFQWLPPAITFSASSSCSCVPRMTMAG